LIAFGPLPSRRLGRSLGVNNVPPKTCTYSCVYCQIGKTETRRTLRSVFYEPAWILNQVEEKVRKAKKAGEPIDYLTFVPNGEPTLDSRLGIEITLLRDLNLKVAVISNASLIGRSDVREDLSKADLVSLKLDAVRELYWSKINRPHPALRLRTILDGILEFAHSFQGELIIETMLVKDINHDDDHLRELAGFLVKIDPAKAYLSIPTRPPADSWVKAPSEGTINRAFQIINDRYPNVECLIGYEGNAFSSSGDFKEDILSITAVHPMQRGAVEELLKRSGLSWDIVNTLVGQGDLCELEFEGNTYFMKSLRNRVST